MMKTHHGQALLSIICSAILLAGCSLGNGEPSESQMRGALSAKFEQVNANLVSKAQQCRNREFMAGGGNPLMALQCLQICAAAGNESCDVSFKLTRFRKVACQKSASEAGYVCDFEAGFDSSSPLVQTTLATVMGAGTVGKGRFLKDGSAWAYLQLD